MPESRAETHARHDEICRILKENWIGSARVLSLSLNAFKSWTPKDVTAVFDSLPPIKHRKLSALGPGARYPPTGIQRWKDVARIVALMGLSIMVLMLVLPYLALTKRGRKLLAESLAKLPLCYFEAVASYVFIMPSDELIKEAARAGKALCVNRWGRFRILDSGYAAISHCWTETMGLEFNNEKIEQDERGLHFRHFRLIMSQAIKCGYEWIWFDLLAIPRNSDNPTTSDARRELKTSVLNTLHEIYRNADAVIILDSLTLHLKTNDPIRTASLLSCGTWLTRVWTYQEIKLARKAFIVTADQWVDFCEMVAVLTQEEQKDYNRWHSMRVEFDRLLPHADKGVSLPDIALSCQNRSSTNHIDYARGFFAVLNLTWKREWGYEDGILEILKSQPWHAARIANMSGIRGLPEPYSWAPKYLARLEGTIFDRFDSFFAGLVGFWYTISVRKILRFGPLGRDESKTLFNLEVLDKDGDTVMIQVTTPGGNRDRLTAWMDEIQRGDGAKLLCAEDPGYADYAHIFLMVVQRGPIPDVCDGTGTVAATAVLDYGEIKGTKLKWWLT